MPEQEAYRYILLKDHAPFSNIVYFVLIAATNEKQALWGL